MIPPEVRRILGQFAQRVDARLKVADGDGQETGDLLMEIADPTLDEVSAVLREWGYPQWRYHFVPDWARYCVGAKNDRNKAGTSYRKSIATFIDEQRAWLNRDVQGESEKEDLAAIATAVLKLKMMGQLTEVRSLVQDLLSYWEGARNDRCGELMAQWLFDHGTCSMPPSASRAEFYLDTQWCNASVLKACADIIAWFNDIESAAGVEVIDRVRRYLQWHLVEPVRNETTTSPDWLGSSYPIDPLCCLRYLAWLMAAAKADLVVLTGVQGTGKRTTIGSKARGGDPCKWRGEVKLALLEQLVAGNGAVVDFDGIVIGVTGRLGAGKSVGGKRPKKDTITKYLRQLEDANWVRSDTSGMCLTSQGSAGAREVISKKRT